MIIQPDDYPAPWHGVLHDNNEPGGPHLLLESLQVQHPGLLLFQQVPSGLLGLDDPSQDSSHGVRYLPVLVSVHQHSQGFLSIQLEDVEDIFEDRYHAHSRYEEDPSFKR